MARLDATHDLKRSAAILAGLVGLDSAQVGPLVNVDVAGDVDPGPMPVVGVGAGGQTAPILECGVADDAQTVDAHRTQRSGIGAEMLDRFLSSRGPDVCGAGGIGEFLDFEFVVAAQQGQRHFTVEHHHHGLDLVYGRRSALDRLQSGDRAHTRGGETDQL